MDRARSARQWLVRELNDAFRTMGHGRGSVLVTEGVSTLGQDVVNEIMAQIKAFDTFSEDNDPWGEHDFGAIELGDKKISWKIDPYNLDLQAYSPNPGKPAITHRVLTIMLASEY